MVKAWCNLVFFAFPSFLPYIVPVLPYRCLRSARVWLFVIRSYMSSLISFMFPFVVWSFLVFNALLTSLLLVNVNGILLIANTRLRVIAACARKDPHLFMSMLMARKSLFANSCLSFTVRLITRGDSPILDVGIRCTHLTRVLPIISSSSDVFMSI